METMQARGQQRLSGEGSGEFLLNEYRVSVQDNKALLKWVVVGVANILGILNAIELYTLKC